MVLATYLVRRPSEWTRDESRQACRGTSVAGDGRAPLEIGVVETRGRGTDESGDGHGEDEDEGRGSQGRVHCSNRRGRAHFNLSRRRMMVGY